MPSKPSVSEQEQKFIAWWKSRRKAKTRHIVRHGLLWGLFTALGSYLLIIRFDFDQFATTDVATRCAVFAVGGVLLAYWFYRINEKRFKQLRSPGN